MSTATPTRLRAAQTLVRDALSALPLMAYGGPHRDDPEFKEYRKTLPDVIVDDLGVCPLWFGMFADHWRIKTSSSRGPGGGPDIAAHGLLKHVDGLNSTEPSRYWREPTPMTLADAVGWSLVHLGPGYWSGPEDNYGEVSNTICDWQPYTTKGWAYVAAGISLDEYTHTWPDLEQAYTLAALRGSPLPPVSR